MCSTPGGIETVISRFANYDPGRIVLCSTPGGIETVIRATGTGARLCRGVLNARRHRDGDQDWRLRSPLFDRLVLNARRHRDGDQSGHLFPGELARSCSTPGGIETVIRQHGHDARRLGFGVLNARRHRDGDQDKCDVLSDRCARCSTPGGIETVIRATTRRTAEPSSSAQRPEASRR